MSSEAGESARTWLRVLHETTYDYDAPVELAHHMAYLVPRATAVQAVRGWSLAIDPLPDEWRTAVPAAASAGLPGVPGVPATQASTDAWGNTRIVFSHARVHDRLRVRAGFDAGLRAVPAPDGEAGPAWEAVAQALRYHAGAAAQAGQLQGAVDFSLPTAYAPRDASLAALAREAFVPGRPLAGGALALMHLIHGRFTYDPQATSVGTRAPQALAARRGVCQDFAHVMIGACRSLGLAARYVSGYLLTQPAPGQPRLVGADASHAWVQVWCPVQGWLALDPTNAVAAGTDHVTLAWGRDYADVAPLRGVIRGGGLAVPRVAVTVTPLDAAAVAGDAAGPPDASGPPA
ncbi:transglutaminase domain-containing protein [Ideonella sp.]|uniref:transglutaminase family protein n=1 Tax=Ideonella sp. TaxID=1929293 RepID=UPI0035B2CCA4